MFLSSTLIHIFKITHSFTFVEKIDVYFHFYLINNNNNTIILFRLTAFPCGGCYDCGAPDYHIDNYFENDQSSTFQKSQCSDCSKRAHCNRAKQECRVTASYSEGSTWKAYEALDKCYIGGFHNKALTEVRTRVCIKL
jgi:hypothetical protein